MGAPARRELAAALPMLGPARAPAAVDRRRSARGGRRPCHHRRRAFALDQRSACRLIREPPRRSPCARRSSPGLSATSRFARARRSRARWRPSSAGEVVDVILTPNPSSPLCWAVIAIELRETDGEYVLWRGTLSLHAGMESADRLAPHTSSVARATARIDWRSADWRCEMKFISRFGRLRDARRA